MAWRIDQSVIRGEIDNRTRDRVTGLIWFAGLADPVELELAGNAWRDLAGRRLEFVNPVAVKPPLSAEEAADFAPRQTGTIGDCTASRRVKVPEVSMEEVLECYRQRKPFPWHWGNSLYLEWFSSANGRVVIESASFLLTISPDITWDMTPAEEEIQRGKNAAAMGGFVEQLGEAMQGDDGGAQFDDAAWSEHPLAEQAFALSVRLMKEPDARGWLPEDVGEEHPLIELGASAAKAGAKLAGALNGPEWPPPVDLCAGVLVQLERAREFLDDALRAAEACAEEGLGEEKWLAAVRTELEELGQATDTLIAELRAKLERGCD